MASAGLQLAAATIDFTRAVTELAGSNAMVLAVRAISSWMAIEKVEEGQMQQFCEFARDKAHPNRHGLEALQNLNNVSQPMLQRIRNAPVSLVAGATLAGLMGNDPTLAYIVTTTAVLAHYHGPEHTASALLETLLDRRGHENGAKRQEYHWASASLGALVSKIVNSVFLNTCNASKSYNIPGLPLDLQNLGRQTLDPPTFAAVTRSVTSSSTDVVIRSEYFFADLVHWLYFHFHGIITIVKQSMILFKESRGTSDQIVTLIITPQDISGSPVAEDKQKTPIEVSVASGSPKVTEKRVFRDDIRLPARGRSWLRKDFSELNDFIQGDRFDKRGVLDDDNNWDIKYTASRILSWILKLPVSLDIESRLLIFDVLSVDGCGDSEGDYVLQDLFPCSPQLLDECNRAKSQQDCIFRSKLMRNATNRDANTSMEDTNCDIENLLTWFPSIAKLMMEYQRICRCQACLKKKSLGACKPGCKREEAITRLLLLLARGFSNAMGGIDASGDGDVLEQKNGMLEMLYSIIEYRRIQWDNLFVLAASVLSGVYASEVFPDAGGENSSWVALQNGSFVVLARWIDLKEERHQSQVFALEVLEGAKILGVIGEIGALRSEGATTDENHTNTDEDGDALMDTKAILDLTRQADSIQLKCQTAIFHIEANCYRLLTLAQAGHFMRNVDVTLVLLGYLTRLEDKCEHSRESETISELGDERIVVVDFDRALGTWGFSSPENVVQTTKLLTDPLKVNIMLSASPEGCVVRDVDRWCFDCALKYLKANAEPVMSIESVEYLEDLTAKCLRIINVDTNSRHKGRSRPRQRHLEG